MAANLKMYCIFSQEAIDKMMIDPEVSDDIYRGKLAAQAGHAFLHAWWDLDDGLRWLSQQEGTDRWDADRYQHMAEMYNEYRRGDDARKITLVVPTDDDLRALVATYEGITGTTLVEDCGYTVFSENTVTCAGIGPLFDWDKGDDLRNLPLLI